MALFIRHKKPGPIKPTANPYPSRFQRWRLSLVFTFSILLIVGSALRLYQPFYLNFQQFVFESSAIIQSFFISPFHEANSLIKETKTYANLKNEYDRLIKENEELKWELQTLSQAEYENKELKKTLKIPVNLDYKKHTVPIISSPYDGLHHFFLVKAGESDGLERNQAVISPEGIVGRLEKVGNFVSRVLLLNDINSKIPVKTATSDQMAILVGDGSFFPALVYVVDPRKIVLGEAVVTSGLGGIFPPGIPVGIVDKVTGDKISIRPYAPFQKLEWVHVLEPISDTYTEELAAAKEGE